MFFPGIEVSGLQALREVEREKARGNLADKQRLDIEYLKNTILKLYETGADPHCPTFQSITMNRPFYTLCSVGNSKSVRAMRRSCPT